MIGRECDGLLLGDPRVSRRHLSLDVDGEGRVIVTDLGSTNGSTLDGRRLEAPVALVPGNVVQCGETTIMLDAPVGDTIRTTPLGRNTVVAGSTQVIDPTKPAPPPDVASPFPVQRPQPSNDDFRRTSIDIVAASVQSDGLNVQSLPVDKGTVTIVFSDIESSTERNVELGDQVWFEVLGTHNRIVADRVARFGGTIIKNQGDGFMLSFPGARKALDCMAGVQRDLVAHSNAHPTRAIRIRIGMHTGEVLADADGDLFGQHVVVAARVANLAEGGEILVSSLTKEITASRGDITFGPARAVMLKGIGDAVVYPLDWTRI